MEELLNIFLGVFCDSVSLVLILVGSIELDDVRMCNPLEDSNFIGECFSPFRFERENFDSICVAWLEPP